MMKIVFLFIIVFGLFFLKYDLSFGLEQSAPAVNALRPKVEFTDEGLRDPFNSEAIIPVEKQSENTEVVEEPELLPPELNIQGMVWGGMHPVVIINGNVFKEGDLTDDCTIVKIQKSGVEVLYKGKNFLLAPPGKKANNP